MAIKHLRASCQVPLSRTLLASIHKHIYNSFVLFIRKLVRRMTRYNSSPRMYALETMLQFRSSDNR